ncbi:non-ribosomal peptide synthetase [Nocardia sp. XZ_19_369]|uniref:non-ribosomal peptide synthetase n=1 Tax=Nocardia sp. XZ_19_369 TaxID=2769487 RepID=UPI00188E2620|nr:non-ribosomal peptide synthetase [Nocardia sp. XZ_19_369]
MSIDELNYTATGAWAEDRAFWARLLADVPAPGSPAAEPIRAAPGYQWLPLGQLDEYRHLVRVSGGDPAALVLAALAVYEYRRTNAAEIVVGWCDGDTRPVPVTLTAQMSFYRVAKQVGVLLRRCRRHRYLPEFDDPWPHRHERAWQIACRKTDGAWEIALPDADHRRFRRVFDALLCEPGAAVGVIDVVAEPERTRLLEWGGAAPGSDCPANTVPELFRRRSDRTPDAVAVIDADTTLTYAELDRESNRWARLLISAGAGPEVVVALLLPRSTDLVVLLLAVAKVGAVYLPIDPEYPHARIEFMLADAAARLVVTSCAGRDLLGADLPLVVIDDPGVSAAYEDDTDLRQRVDPRNALYVVYTSGSTGTPKGVVVTHAGVANLVSDRLAAKAGRRVLVHSPMVVDAFTFELWAPLLGGGTAVLAPPGRLDAATLGHIVAAQHITTLFLTTRLFELLVAEQPEIFDTVDEVLVGGEAVPAEPFSRALSRGRTRLTNGYGPTETTTFATVSTFTPGITIDQHTVPIGRPLRGVAVFVLGSGLALASVGAVGELYVSGAGVSRGYVGGAGATAARFVAHPFGTGERLYRTGDVVRWNSAGILEFIGRVDGQVKVRGFRVELGEVEAVLRSHPSVRHTVVVLRAGTGLVGYVVPASGVSAAELRDFVAARVPEFMVPVAFVVLDSFPLTVNGKLDRASLPEPELSSGTAYRAPVTELERVLTDVFADVLGLPRVGADDNFFELGGDSISSIQLVSRSRAVGVSFTPQDVFAHRTPGALAAIATPVTDASSTRADEGVEVALSRRQREHLDQRHPGGIEDILPLTPLQDGLMFHAAAGGPDLYVVQLDVQLAGRLDPALLRASVRLLTDRHPGLRAVFEHDGLERPVQVIVRRAEVPWRQVDLSAADEAAQRQELARLRAAEQADGFDLATGPLLRWLLVDLSAHRHRLILTSHHILWDGWSVPVLLGELLAIYAANADTSGLAPVLQPRAFCTWLAAQDRAAATAAWRAVLDGVTGPTLLAGSATAADRTAARAVVETTMPEAVTTGLGALAQRCGTTLNTVLQATWGMVLAQLTGRDDVIFGTPVSGRPPHLPGVETAIGLFINTVPVRVRLDADIAVSELLARLHADQMRLLDHHHLGLSEIGGLVGHSELFDTLLTFENYPIDRESFDLPGTELALVGVDGADATHYALDIRVIPGARLGVRIGFRTNAFEPSTVDAIVARWQRLIVTVTADPDIEVRAVDLLGPGERELLLRWGGQVDEGADAAATIPETLAGQVRRTPNAVALAFGDTALTYAQLDRESNRVAHSLLERGVGPETTVAVLSARSPNLIVWLLAIWKAGGCYLPIDPEYPSARIEFMVADARPVLMVTTVDLLETVRECGVPVLTLDDPRTVRSVLEQDPGPVTDRSRARPLRPADAAYLIYTSGSTGSPKGVVGTHGGLVHRLAALQHEYRLAADDVVLQKTPTTFDVSLLEILWPLQIGASVLVAAALAHRDPARLAETIRTGGVTTVHFVPSMLAEFIELPEAARCRSLRRIFASGEALPAHVAGRVLERSGARLYNLYGPTETTVEVTCHEVTAADPDSVPIGRPVGGVVLRVLDARLRLVAVGVPGELYVSGSGVAQGYSGRPGLTASRFVADPYGRGGARAYATGDVVRWRTDGRLEFLGRADDQIQLRGLRIEPGEIEVALAQHPSVRRAVVTFRNGAGGARLVGYVTTTETDTDAAVLRSFLSSRLPRQLVPAAIVVLDQFPVSPSGKMERRALPEPEFAAGAVYRAPRTELEVVIARVFAAVLGVDRVGLDDDFFDLGGHSLLLIPLVDQLRAATRCEIDVSQLFDHSRVVELAEFLVRGTDLGNSRRFADDVVLADDIQPGGNRAATTLERVLVTGATGFLGSHLVGQLLAQTDADIYCLVRAPTSEIGHRRVEDAMRRYGAGPRIGSDRIRIVLGDLSARDLGLTPRQFADLAASVDAIVHSGARTNHIATYGHLYESNVASLEYLLRLAVTERLKPLHFVSTASVLGDAGLPTADQVPHSGYLQTKWVGEQILRIARARGIPVSIYRPGLIGGDTESGAGRSDDAFWNLIRACVALEKIPAGMESGVVAMAPVDLVARSLVRAVLEPTSIGADHDLHAEHAVSIVDLRAELDRNGFPLRVVPPAEFAESLDRSSAEQSARGEHDLTRARLISSTLPPGPALGPVRLGSERIGRDVLRKYIDHYVRSGFFARVADGSNNAAGQRYSRRRSADDVE